MSEHRLRAEQISREKAKRKEERIDECMLVARKELATLERQADPYAMHKAVESLPTEVLIDILSRVSERLLTTGAQE